MPRSNVDQDRLDELELLKEVRKAIRQHEKGQGIPHEEARQRALGSLRS